MSKKRKLQKYIEKTSRNAAQHHRDSHDRSNVRLSIPFNMCCETCSEHIPMGKKYYTTKATSNAENYLGVEVYVFEFKCPECRSPIRFKTDPKNGVYTSDYNCKKVCEDKEKQVKIVKNEEYEANIDRLRQKELSGIKKFVENSRNADIDKIKENLKRRFRK